MGRRIGGQLDSILTNEFLSPKDPGRVANSAVKALGCFFTGPSVFRPLDAHMNKSLTFLRQRVAEG